VSREVHCGRLSVDTSYETRSLNFPRPPAPRPLRYEYSYTTIHENRTPNTKRYTRRAHDADATPTHEQSSEEQHITGVGAAHRILSRALPNTILFLVHLSRGSIYSMSRILFQICRQDTPETKAKLGSGPRFSTVLLPSSAAHQKASTVHMRRGCMERWEKAMQVHVGQVSTVSNAVQSTHHTRSYCFFGCQHGMAFEVVHLGSAFVTSQDWCGAGVACVILDKKNSSGLKRGTKALSKFKK